MFSPVFCSQMSTSLEELFEGLSRGINGTINSVLPKLSASGFRLWQKKRGDGNLSVTVRETMGLCRCEIIVALCSNNNSHLA